jgi:hypothetical protein
VNSLIFGGLMPRKKKNLLGERFGLLTVIEEIAGRGARWKCECDCGGEKITQSSHLFRGVGLHCGCQNLSRSSLEGRRFGSLTVQSLHSVSRNRHTRWMCKCDCGKTKDVLGTHLLSGKTKSCGCAMYPSGSDSKLWKGHGEINGSFFSDIRRGAAGGKGRRSIPFSITIEYIWKIWQSQKGKCALSGIEIELPRTNSVRGTASLDRIDSGCGYVEGNIQWVHKDVNLMKGKLGQDRFLKLCHLIASKENCDG